METSDQLLDDAALRDVMKYVRAVATLKAGEFVRSDLVSAGYEGIARALASYDTHKSKGQTPSSWVKAKAFFAIQDEVRALDIFPREMRKRQQAGAPWVGDMTGVVFLDHPVDGPAVHSDDLLPAIPVEEPPWDALRDMYHAVALLPLTLQGMAVLHWGTLGLAQKEIGALYGVSGDRVCQHLRQAAERIRAALAHPLVPWGRHTGGVVRHLRCVRDLSQAVCARAMRIDRAVLQRVECDDTFLPSDAARRRIQVWAKRNYSEEVPFIETGKTGNGAQVPHFPRRRYK